MQFLRSRWSTALLFAVILVAFTVGILTYLSRSALRDQILYVFDSAFASKVADPFGRTLLRVRNGSEIFCIQEDDGAHIKMGPLINTISLAFELEWELVNVVDLLECPRRTTYYVLHDVQLNQGKVLDLMLKIVGSKPPDPDRLFPKSAIAFTSNIPGFGYREFIFVKMRETVSDRFATSIMLEELIQASLRASDVPSTNIVSLLGENPASPHYSHWFDYNPAGLCSVDVILMELFLSPSKQYLKYRYRNTMRDYIASNYNELIKAAESKGRALASYSDPRCWIW